MDLVPFMYWERQEVGSQLCAQHCLNNLLQANNYTEFDLAEIARRLDQAENAALASPNQNKKSYNFDDTGYFSISVLERALEVWDLTLVRWRGEAMRPYQEKPEEQAAFILHLSSHWIPLRRFSPHPLPASSTKRWYNLNSFLPNGPEWISPTYLRMVLTQAEEEGYSVFVVRQATPEAKEGQDTKEAEGWGDGGVGVIPECEADRMAMVLGEPVGRSGGVTSPTRSGFGGGGAGTSRVPLVSANPDQPTVDPASNLAGPSSPPSRRRRRQADLLDQTATDEYAQIQPPGPPRNPARNSSRDILDDETGTFPDTGEDHGEEEVREDDDVDEDYELVAAQRRYDRYAGPTDFSFQSRSYDDEDAALQAALKASMEDLPADWVPPVAEPKEKVQKAKSPSLPALPPVPTAPPPIFARDDSKPSGGSRFKEEVEDDEDDAPAEAISPDEIRRRRLAKFGQ